MWRTCEKLGATVDIFLMHPDLVPTAEKLLRDAKIGKIYEGTSFLQLETIAKTLIKEGLGD